jgi:polar amino acid transport system substrate-binding protein
VSAVRATRRRAAFAAAALLLAPAAAWLTPRLAAALRHAEVVRRGYLVVGVPLWMPPFGAPAPSGGWVGLDVAVAQALAEEALGSRQRLHLLPLPPADRLWALAHGEADAVAAAFAGPAPGSAVQAPPGVALVGPYFADALRLLVRRGAWVAGPRSLDGQVVGVLGGGRGAAAAAAWLAPYRAVLRPLPDAPAALRDLGTGRVRAVVGATVALSALARYDPELAVQGRPVLGEETFWIALRAEDAWLVAAARRALGRLPRGRALLARLRAWSTAPAPPWPSA